jgi:hypothetical protein
MFSANCFFHAYVFLLDSVPAVLAGAPDGSKIQSAVVVDIDLPSVIALSLRVRHMRGCVVYALPRPMRSLLHSSLFLIEGAHSPIKNNLAICVTRLFRRRFPCAG